MLITYVLCITVATITSVHSGKSIFLNLNRLALLRDGILRNLRFPRDVSHLYALALCFGRKTKPSGTGPSSISLKRETKQSGLAVYKQ